MPKNLVELVKEEDFDPFLQKNRDKLVLVKFSAEWCGPCKILQASIDKLLEEMEQSVSPQKDLVVLKVDVEKFLRLAQRPQFKVRSLPTFFLFHQGKMVKERQEGSRSVEWLREFIAV